jgi:hypothetical protein
MMLYLVTKLVADNDNNSDIANGPNDDEQIVCILRRMQSTADLSDLSKQKLICTDYAKLQGH